MDSYGALLSMTGGRKHNDPSQISARTARWQRQFAAASYLWLEWNSGRIPWTRARCTYPVTHFRPLGPVNGYGAQNAPVPGLYQRR